MTKIECDAKKKVAKCLNYGVNEKELEVVCFNETGVHAQVLLRNDQDDRYFEVTYYDNGKCVVAVYDIIAVSNVF